jgi:hypothetical protein
MNPIGGRPAQPASRACGASWLARVALLAALAGCAHVQSPGAVSLRIDANVPDATVWIDDVLVGTVAEWSRDQGHGGHAIRPGFHRLELRHPGHYAYFQELEPLDGARVVIKAELHPLLE